jgi:hypothetical protein
MMTSCCHGNMKSSDCGLNLLFYIRGNKNSIILLHPFSKLHDLPENLTSNVSFMSQELLKLANVNKYSSFLNK